jgi:DNA-binding beta-propeller fold protein YncE
MTPIGSPKDVRRSHGRAARVAVWLALPGGLAAVLVAIFFGGGGFSAEKKAPGEAVAKTIPTMSFEQDGLRVEMSAGPAAATAATDGGADRSKDSSTAAALPAWTQSELRFTVREAKDGERPITGLRPLAWLVRRAEGEAVPERGPATKGFIQSLLSTRVSSGADVNLNEYVVVTLDDNPSLSIIDPQIDSSKTKVLGIVSLSSRGADFVLADDRRTVLVTVPDSHEVAVANLSKRLASHLHVGGEPYRIAYQPDRRFAWVGDREGRSVTAIDAQKLETTAKIDVAIPGPHEFAFREDSGIVFVSSPASSRVAVIDVRSMQTLRRIDLDSSVAGISYSPHGRRAFAALDTGAVVAIDGDRLEAVQKIDLPDGSSGFSMSPDGRWGFVLNAARDHVTIVDAATGRPAYTILTEADPDRIDFTSNFAYVRHAASELMVLIELASIGEANVPVTSTVILGRKPPTEGGFKTVAPLLAPLPEGGGALVLNPADRSVYHFVEGMNAPMGEYPSYPWTARGILIVDRTIREIEKGVYTSEFQSPRPGAYTVAFLVPSSPQLYGCFDLAVEKGEKSGPGEVALELLPVFASETFPPNEASRVVVRLTEKATGLPAERLRDVFIVVTHGPAFQWRGPAMPIGDGRYEVLVPFEGPGRYAVLVGCASRGIRPGEIPSRYAVVGPAATKAAVAPKAKERS